jgi:tyrosine-protein phosphatase SIW14
MNQAMLVSWILGFLLGSIPCLSYGADAPLENFAAVHEGEIYRGGKPTRETDYQYLKDHGVRTILNLRKYVWWEEEREAEMAGKYGIRYLHSPVDSVLPPSEDSIERAVEYLADASLYPIYVHCKRGKDRTGLVVAQYRVEKDGWQPEAAIEEMRAYHYAPYIVGVTYYLKKHLSHAVPAPK